MRQVLLLIVEVKTTELSTKLLYFIDSFIFIVLDVRRTNLLELYNDLNMFSWSQ